MLLLMGAIKRLINELTNILLINTNLLNYYDACHAPWFI